MKAITARIAECVLTSVFISAIIVVIYYFEIFPRNDFVYGVMTLAGSIIYIVMQINALRITYTLFEGRNDYYKINFTAYSVFIILTAIIYKLIDKRYVYTWMFAITKSTSYFYDGINIVESAAMFHAIMLLMILIAPVGLHGKVGLEKEIPDEMLLTFEMAGITHNDEKWDGKRDYFDSREEEWYKPEEIDFREEDVEWDGVSDYKS